MRKSASRACADAREPRVTRCAQPSGRVFARTDGWTDG